MKFKINYLARNILLGFLGLVVIDIIIFRSASLAKHSLLIWDFVIIFLLFLFAFLKRRTGKFISGSNGEVDIDSELKDLDKGFIYISGGLNTGRGNIDKIIVGPTGVWTLEVKSHKGDITFDGQTLLRDQMPLEKDFLGQAYSEAKTLQKLIKSNLGLDIRVQPVLVFSDKYAKVRLGLNKYKGVYVVQKAWLTKLLTEIHTYSLEINTIKRLETLLSQF